jgi:hypothetical protein
MFVEVLKHKITVEREMSLEEKNKNNKKISSNSQAHAKIRLGTRKSK